jgi:hypothetical protein
MPKGEGQAKKGEKGINGMCPYFTVERMARILKIDLCLRARGRPRKVKKE